jgi:DNA-directed RNA polymerase subunit RPC12/RpoP
MSQNVRDIMKYRKISLVCLFIALPINVLNMFLGIRFLTILGISLLLIFFIIALTLWRCPKCKKRLPIRFDQDTDVDDIYRCPYCDTKFLSGKIID